MKMCKHPNVVLMADFYNNVEWMYLVTPYASLGDLSMMIKKRQCTQDHFSESQILTYFTQMCFGLR